MKQEIFFAVGLFLMMNVMGQQTGKCNYHSINNVAVLKGGSDASLQLQTISGVQYKNFFGGIGVGLDNYYFKTVPLFVDLRKNFLEKKKTPFAYVDLGVNIPWDRAKIESWSTSYYSSGFLYDMGVGYSIPIKGRFSLNLSAGYSEKILNESRETTNWGWIDFMGFGKPAIMSKDTADYKYTFRRVSLKIGISF
jgi:hypothetical protein